MTAVLHGVVDMPADAYHRHGALSSSGARKLLPPSCPALFDYECRHPMTPTDEMQFGTAVHTLTLGTGTPVVEIVAKDYMTKVAKEAKAAALAEGKVPLLSKDYAKAKDVAAAVRRHPLAAKLLDEKAGAAEQSLFWVDPETGVQCRARLDFLRGRLASDLKTCASAAPAKVEKAVWDLGYFIQVAHYLEGMRQLGIAKNPGMALIFVERARPHLVNVVQLNPLALEAGAHYARQARLIFAECTESGVWPGWGDDIQTIELPAYAQNLYFQETGR